MFKEVTYSQSLTQVLVWHIVSAATLRWAKVLLKFSVKRQIFIRFYAQLPDATTLVQQLEAK